MSPTQASPVNDRDFPRLNGRNFIIWKTRITAALDGKNLLGFVTQADYAGDSDVDLGPDEELNPAYSEQLDASLTRLGVPKPDSQEDSSTSESSDGSSDGSAGDDGDVDMGQEKPPMIQPFTAQKQQELDRAEKLKAKSQQLSSKKLRLMEAKAKAFLIKTIDDQHVLMVKEKTTAYEIYQTLCSKYEGAAVHGDPYYIQSYLMALKYEEGSDLATFIYDLESAMTTTADSTNSVLSDEQKSLDLYHSLPTDWKSELAVWKGSRKYIPYEDLKRNIETKVQNELARNRYVLKQGTPESRETRTETAMQASAPEQVLVAAPSNTDTVLVSSLKCTYCQRDNHDTVDCYILQRHLYNGQIKAGTMLPANFKLKPPQQQQQQRQQHQPLQHQHPYKGNYNGKGGNQSRHNNNKGLRNGNRGNHGRSQWRNKYHGRRNRDEGDNNDYGVVAITTVDLSQESEEVSLTTIESDHDPMWTVDPGCTRHVTSSSKWFENLKPTVGKAITVGGNHQIPIKGTGDVKMKIKDTKGKERIIVLNDVLYAPDLKFNLLSVRQTVGSDYKINFPNAKKCVLFFAHRVKFEAKTGGGKSLYQFQAKSTDSDQEAHVATSGSG